ncbi:MAG: hypothetical protein PHG86_04655 [Candidatus Methanomethylophilaceae archaeon]|nr:hypothetical protein [Candidatus Methanomethylophilaceae archaeon]
MADDNLEFFSKEEMYKILLQEYEECKDEGREIYLRELLDQIRKELNL